VVLGCTHYPFLLDGIRAVVGPQVQVTRAPRWRAASRGAGEALGGGTLRCYTSGNAPTQQALMCRLLGEAVTVEPLPEASCVPPLTGLAC
jgi:glutamate racemase